MLKIDKYNEKKFFQILYNTWDISSERVTFWLWKVNFWSQCKKQKKILIKVITLKNE